MKQKNRVLVIGINQTLVLNVVQSLSLMDIHTVVLAPQKIAPLQLFNSRCHYLYWQNLTINHGKIDQKALKHVEDVCKTLTVDIVVPADHESILLLNQALPEQGIPTCIVPDTETVEQLHNKWHLYQYLTSLNIPCPNSEYIDSTSALENTKLSFPMITKPIYGWASVGFEVHQTKEELITRCRQQDLKADYPLLAQTLAVGYDVGLSFIANQGEIVAYCMFHANIKRTRTFFDDPAFLAIIAKIIKVSNYSGIGNWDAIYNPETKEYKILELNPRFWASMLYTNNAGINFPYLMIHPELWDANNPHQAKLGVSRNTLYERLMSLSTRLSNHYYNKVFNQ